VSWNRDQINQLAPDSDSIKAAEKLSTASKWSLLEFNEKAIWGHCQGSGKKPYMTRIDLREIAFKCSCPSRKFPCKHGLSLFYLYAEQNTNFKADVETPDWVEEWLITRSAKAEKKAEKVNKPVNKEAQEKRQKSRSEKVSQGIDDLMAWLQDLARVGISELTSKDYAYWDGIAARLVDAQVTGLANSVKEMSAHASSGNNSMELLAGSIAKLHLLLQAYRNINELPVNLQHDVKQRIGWPVNKDEVMSSEGVSDIWIVLGVIQRAEDNLVSQTVWLQGVNTKRSSLVLEFAHQTQRASLSMHYRVGGAIKGDAYFYPSATPNRVLFGECEALDGNFNVIDWLSLHSLIGAHKHMELSNPWCNPSHGCIEGVRFAGENGNFFCVVDEPDVVALPVDASECNIWKLISLSGGLSVSATLVWDGSKIKPIGIWINNEYTSVLKVNSQ
jgi:hypothetical protein